MKRWFKVEYRIKSDNLLRIDIIFAKHPEQIELILKNKYEDDFLKIEHIDLYFE